MNSLPRPSIMPENAIQEPQDLAFYLAGMADASSDEKARRLDRAASWLQRVSREVCGQGYFDCHGGANCTSDHK